MAQRKNLINPLWFIIPDAIWMGVSLGLALTLKYGEEISKESLTLHYKVFVPVFLAWLLVSFMHNLFDAKTLQRYLSLFFSILSAAFFNFFVAISYFYFQPELILTPRRFLLTTIGFWFLLSLSWHLVMKVLLQKRIREEYVLFSPNGELDDLSGEILRHNYLGLRVTKHISTLEELSVMPTSNVSLIVSEASLMDPHMARNFYQIHARGMEIIGQIDFYERLLRRVPLEYLSEAWILKNVDAGISRFQSFVRRTLDIIVGVLFGIVFLLTFPFIVLAIKIDSAGSIFFIQPRVGKNGRSFNLYKYRNMTANGSTKGWTQINDPRITGVGKILRKTHLDELPQFINLLRGDMSIVGPRPEQIEIVEQMQRLIPFYDERHLVKPGLTGWAQLHIYAGTIEETKRKLEYDLYYMKHRSILFDFEIILKTLYFILNGTK